MARPLRIEYEGAFYHVTSRGNERKRIFSAKADYNQFKTYLKKAQKKYGCRLHCYVLMQNHYHLVMETPEGNLSQVMQYINGSYTSYFNRRRRRSGHLLFKCRRPETVSKKQSDFLVNGGLFFFDLLSHRRPPSAEGKEDSTSNDRTDMEHFLHSKPGLFSNRHMMPNPSLPDSRSPVWLFGAPRLGNQTFDLQNPRDNRFPSGRYHGEPAGQLGISGQHDGSYNRKACIWKIICRLTGIGLGSSWFIA